MLFVVDSAQETDKLLYGLSVKEAKALKLSPTKRTPVSEMVLQQLVEAIRSGSLSPGERLPTEAELARSLEVGRSSVREALRVLVVMELIETRPGRGAHVLRRADGILPERGSTLALAKHLERVALQDLFEAREAVEGRAAELAAARATDEDLAEVERCCLAVEQKVVHGKTYYDANVAFHVAIAKASRNYVLVESVRQLHGHHRSFRERLMSKEAVMRDRDLAEHRAIVAALRDRDPLRARDEMINHIGSSLEIIRRFELGETVTSISRSGARSYVGAARQRQQTSRTRKQPGT